MGQVTVVSDRYVWRHNKIWAKTDRCLLTTVKLAFDLRTSDEEGISSRQTAPSGHTRSAPADRQTDRCQSTCKA